MKAWTWTGMHYKSVTPAFDTEQECAQYCKINAIEYESIGKMSPFGWSGA